MPKYKSKIELESGAVKYEYGRQAIKERASKKLHQCRVVEDNIEKIINRVISDVKRNIDEALAVGIMLCTYERIGNDDSAQSGHFGVTNLEARHFTDNKSHIEIDYVGKSGVVQHKEIYDPVITSAIRQKLKRCQPRARIILCTPQACNEWLRPFNCTSKDVRTFAANRLMAHQLKEADKVSGNNGWARKRRAKIFYDAVGVVSKDLGHRPKTLIDMYLNNVLVKNYIKTGAIRENPSIETQQDIANYMTKQGIPCWIYGEFVVCENNGLIGIQKTDSGYTLIRSDSKTIFRTLSGLLESLKV